MRFLNLIILLFLCGVCDAALIDVELEDGKTGFRNENNELIWLDPIYTAGYSYNKVEDELRFGGEFYGWKLASEQNVYSLWSRFLKDDSSFFFGDTYGIELSSNEKMRKAWLDIFDATGFVTSGKNGKNTVSEEWFSFSSVYKNESGLLSWNNVYYGIETGSLIGENRLNDVWEIKCEIGDTACSPIDYSSISRNDMSVYLVKERAADVTETSSFLLISSIFFLLFNCRYRKVLFRK